MRWPASSLTGLSLVVALVGSVAWAVGDTTAVVAVAPFAGQADPAGRDRKSHTPDGQAQQLAEWVRRTGDNRARPFAIIDKQTAQVHVYAESGREIAASPVLVGSARGDDSVPGIGERPIHQIRASERTTPAGRFESEPGTNAQGEDIVWVDYEAAVSLHRVRPTVAAEKRLERLASRRSQDRRITYGCINVPSDFYDAHIRPAFGQAPGVVYVLPETRPWPLGQPVML